MVSSISCWAEVDVTLAPHLDWRAVEYAWGSVRTTGEDFDPQMVRHRNCVRRAVTQDGFTCAATPGIRRPTYAGTVGLRRDGGLAWRIFLRSRQDFGSL